MTMRLKKGIKRRNVLYIFFLTFLAAVCFNDKMGMEQALLENAKYFALTSQETVNLQSQAASY